MGKDDKGLRFVMIPGNLMLGRRKKRPGNGVAVIEKPAFPLHLQRMCNLKRRTSARCYSKRSSAT